MTDISITEARPVQTQFLIFTFFNDYVLDRGNVIWTSALLQLMQVLGVSERALRSALSRMTRKGWLVSQKQGRMSQYALTPRGQTLLVRGAQRIFEPAFTDWDGCWQLLVYSLPEEQRDKRHILRKQLSWLGFGLLAPGAWGSPRDRREEVDSLLAELDIHSSVNLFSGVYLGPATADQLVERCWNLQALAAQYESVLQRFEPQYHHCLEALAAGQSLPAKQSFIDRFWLTHEFASFPQTDPNLPTSLLPADWVGTRARRRFADYRQLLHEPAHRFVDDIINGSSAALSRGFRGTN